jgi:hypothetical protein
MSVHLNKTRRHPHVVNTPSILQISIAFVLSISVAGSSEITDLHSSTGDSEPYANALETF